jgi:hypothetical protein
VPEIYGLGSWMLSEVVGQAAQGAGGMLRKVQNWTHRSFPAGSDVGLPDQYSFLSAITGTSVLDSPGSAEVENRGAQRSVRS